jgi:hypothetical protein
LVALPLVPLLPVPPVPQVLLLLVLQVPQAPCLAVVVRTGTAGQQSWSQLKAMQAVVGTALAAEVRIEVAQSLLAEAGSTELVQVLHRWLAVQHTSLALAARKPWLVGLRKSLGQAARTQQVAEQHMSLGPAAHT